MTTLPPRSDLRVGAGPAPLRARTPQALPKPALLLPLRLTVLLAVLLGLPRAARADWGGDLEPVEGKTSLLEIQGDLLGILQAKPEERPAKVRSFLDRGGKHTLEAIKRFRNPELADLFRTLLDFPEWHYPHRGLLALERLGDRTALERAWIFLENPERRMRERAAIACLRLWDGAPPPVDLEGLVRREQDLHVRRALEALRARVAGRLAVEVVAPEHVVPFGKDGLRVVPFVEHMQDLATVAPGWTGKPDSRVAPLKGGGARTGAAESWTAPLLAYGEEEVPTTSLQPFANLSREGTVQHVGQDVGACLDGAGVYAAAAGTVRLVAGGTDLGTTLVLEHVLPGGRLVHAVYLHLGDAVFVRPGDAVGSGQLLATVGLSWSLENGGDFAHLHYALYPGPFDPRRTYAERPAASGVADWLDPAEFLPIWRDRTQPVLPSLRAPSPALDAAVASAERGDLTRAWTDALRLRDAAERSTPAWADADEVLQGLKEAPRNALRRSDALVEGGYPREAQDLLQDLARRGEAIPGMERVVQRLETWKEDPSFALAVKGQPKVAAAEERALKEKDPAKMRAVWQDLLAAYGETCLGDRIRESAGR